MTSQMKQQQNRMEKSQSPRVINEDYSRNEICQKLQLDRVTVHRDIQFLRQQAQYYLEKRIHETIPEEYQHCLTGIKPCSKYGLVHCRPCLFRQTRRNLWCLKKKVIKNLEPEIDENENEGQLEEEESTSNYEGMILTPSKFKQLPD